MNKHYNNFNKLVKVLIESQKTQIVLTFHGVKKATTIDRLQQDGNLLVYVNNKSGNKMWFNKSGKLHRDGKPAIIGNSIIEYYTNGLLHRIDGPALIHNNNIFEWRINGKRHREDGPAYIGEDVREWYKNGKIHRDDGPAVEWYDHDEWWVNGKHHRINAPAVVFKDGKELWFTNGKLHRIGGPAVDLKNNYKAWWVNGKLHREDGPAVEHGDKYEDVYMVMSSTANAVLSLITGKSRYNQTEFYINGKKLNEQEFNNYLIKKKLNKEILKREDNIFDKDFLEEL